MTDGQEPKGSLIGRNLLAGAEADPAGDSGHEGHPPRMGFFTDTSVCIGCKACEVACKEWNAIPEDGLEFTGMSYDNSQGLDGSTWRHVAFIEQNKDVCPTGSLFRTEFGTVVVQEDICNGCGYCVPTCPFGVIDQRPEDGRVFKCTLCYDRLGAGQEPACAKACPTESIQFGPLDELRERAAARLYGHDPEDGAGGDGAFFLLLDEPEVYGLPPDPVVTTRDLPAMWRHAGAAGLTLLGGMAAVFAVHGRNGGKR
ncbi:4Fe-4S dicluster domain-containing protein [Streptomyces sp. NPDC021212]|uniref:4Fe-4S dicluster domain-containing protein n=1 Tax=Streptomyces sp. NPDC021212 TaxID=3365118 RepID=UPI003794D7B0